MPPGSLRAALPVLAITTETNVKKTKTQVGTTLKDISPGGFVLVDEHLGRVVGGMVAREGSSGTTMATLTLNSDADVAYDLGGW